jgi:hypothetical protein
MLIMASRDHTAHARLWVRNEPNSESTASAGESSHSLDAEQMGQQAYASKRAGAALAVAVIEGMLKTHRKFQRANPGGKRLGLLPLSPVQLIGLEAAIDLLHHYVDVLDSEVSG